MPNYINNARTRFNHPLPCRPQHSPHQYIPPVYGAKQQFAHKEPPHYPFTKAQETYVSEVAGTFLHYAREIDSTMLPAVSTIATHQTTAAFQLLKSKIDHLLDYAATYPDVQLKFIVSEIHLWVNSDASYRLKQEL